MTARAEDTQRELVDTLTFPTSDCKRSAKVAFQKKAISDQNNDGDNLWFTFQTYNVSYECFCSGLNKRASR